MSNNTQQPWLGYLLTIIAALSFACSLVLARVTYDYGSNPETVLVVRFSALAVLLVIWNTWRGKSLAIPPKLIALSMLVGLAYFIGIGSYLSSVAYMPVSLAVLIFYTFPILVTLISAAIHKHWPHPLQILALVIAFAGLILALDVETDGVQLIGLVFAVLASLGVTANMLSSAHVLKQVSTTVFSFYMALSTLLLSLVVTLFNGEFSPPHSTEGIIYFAGMLLFFFSGYICTYNAVRLIGPVLMSPLMNLEPIATSLLAVLLLEEVLLIQQVWGGAIVIFGILLAQLPGILAFLRRKRQSK